jgi:hypothetical protein
MNNGGSASKSKTGGQIVMGSGRNILSVLPLPGISVGYATVGPSGMSIDGAGGGSLSVLGDAG